MFIFIFRNHSLSLFQSTLEFLLQLQSRLVQSSCNFKELQKILKIYKISINVKNYLSSVQQLNPGSSLHGLSSPQPNERVSPIPGASEGLDEVTKHP